MRIVFFQQGINCHGHSPWEKPLGGTESAMILMAKALAGRGHEIQVFCETDKPGLYDGVTYTHWKHFEEYGLSHSIDVLIAIRSLAIVMARRWAKLQIYFTPDATDQPFANGAMRINLEVQGQQAELGLYSLRFVHRYADAIFFVSHWQARTFQDRFKIPGEKCHVVFNGVNLADFPSPGAAIRKRQIIYASTPFRGLKFLLDYFPEIRRQVPDATCAVVSGMQIYGQSVQDDARNFGDIYKLAQQPGVTLYPPAPKQDLARLLSESRLMAYPNTFAETFCMAVLEAQAAGLPVVTTKLAGLCERIDEGEDGYLVAGHPSQDDYRKAFIASVVRLLTDDDLWHHQSQKAQLKARDYSYENLSAGWEKLFGELMATSAAAGRDPFVPMAQTCDVLVDGYPKRIELSQEMLLNAYCQMLRSTGFPVLAGQVSGLRVAS